MNGPEHYRTAEILLTNLRQELSGAPGKPLRTTEQQARMIAEAQVHATLALAAATTDAAQYGNQSVVDFLGRWNEVTA